MERSCDIFENLSCHKFQHLVLHLPGGILVDFPGQPRGKGKVVFSTKVDNLCYLELFPIPLPRSGMPRLPRKRILVKMFTTGMAFLLLALSFSRDDDMQWRIQGGFLVARKPPSGHDFFKQSGYTVSGTDLHLPLIFTSFGNPP